MLSREIPGAILQEVSAGWYDTDVTLPRTLSGMAFASSVHAVGSEPLSFGTSLCTKSPGPFSLVTLGCSKQHTYPPPITCSGVGGATEGTVGGSSLTGPLDYSRYFPFWTLAKWGTMMAACVESSPHPFTSCLPSPDQSGSLEHARVFPP